MRIIYNVQWIDILIAIVDNALISRKEFIVWIKMWALISLFFSVIMLDIYNDTLLFAVAILIGPLPILFAYKIMAIATFIVRVLTIRNEILGKRILTIEDDALVETTVFKTRFRWSLYYRTVLTKKLAILYFSEHKFYILPLYKQMVEGDAFLFLENLKAKTGQTKVFVY